MRYAWDAVRRRPGRTAASAAGVGGAIALVVMLLALSSGISASADSLAAASGVDLLITSANTSLSSSVFPPVSGAHALPAQVRSADPNVASASPWLVADLVIANASLYARANASAGGSDVPAGWAPTGTGVVGWVPGDNAGIETPTLLRGPGFSDAGDPHFGAGSYAGPATHELELDQGLAGVLGASVGSLVWVSPAAPSGPTELRAWYAAAVPFRVVGVSGPFWLIPSALLAFGYLSEVQGVLASGAPPEDTASLVLVHLTDASRAATDQSLLATALPGLTVFTVGDVLGEVASAVDVYRTFGSLVGAIGVAVSALFTTTVLLMSVDDRSREIALLRAIGFGPRWVATELATEGLVLAFLGLALGAPLGVLGAEVINRFLLGLVGGLPNAFTFIRFDASVVGSTLVIVVVVGLGASLLPAARALRLPVAAELRAP